jgi:hypothetical protein
MMLRFAGGRGGRSVGKQGRLLLESVVVVAEDIVIDKDRLGCGRLMWSLN